MIDTIKNILPVATRKKIKNKIAYFVSPKINSNQIDNEVTTDWSASKSEKHDIIIFSVISWQYRFQRPQQIASQLSKKGHRVFYVDNEFLISKKGKTPVKANKIDKNIFEIKLSSSQNYFIYTDIINSSDQQHILNSIHNLIKTAKIQKPVLIIDHPFWYQVCNKLKFPIIYDCMDDHSQFKENSRQIINLEEKLIKLSKYTIVSNKKLLQKFSQYKNKITQIGNGVDYKYFSSEKINSRPSDLPKDKKVTFGYYGAINSWIDENFIENTIKNKNINFIMIGRVENKNIINLSKQYKNLILLGEKKYSDIKKYLDFFDVCTIPFKLNDLILATDPVKLYEYMATGKPIISSKIPEVQKIEDILFYDENNIEKTIKTAIGIIGKLSIKNIEISKKYDWSVKASQFENLVNHCYSQQRK